MTEEKKYLGDGLYAEDDGFQITLSTGRAIGMHFVCLDDSTLRSFLNFIESTRNVKITVEEK